MRRRSAAVICALLLCCLLPLGALAEAQDPKLEAMMPILDSLVRTMGIEGEVAYAPKDPEFFWTTLYLMGVNWGHTHPLVEQQEDGSVRVRRPVMQEFASAAFLEYDDLLEVPAGLAESVKYLEEWDAYELSPSDIGDTVTRLDGVVGNEDGSVTATVTLYGGEGEKLGSIRFSLVANPYAQGISEPTYLYTVSAAETIGQ